MIGRGGKRVEEFYPESGFLIGPKARFSRFDLLGHPYLMNCPIPDR
jgi:hypothetical protein